MRYSWCNTYLDNFSEGIDEHNRPQRTSFSEMMQATPSFPPTVAPTKIKHSVNERIPSEEGYVLGEHFCFHRNLMNPKCLMKVKWKFQELSSIITKYGDYDLSNFSSPKWNNFSYLFASPTFCSQSTGSCQYQLRSCFIYKP